MIVARYALSPPSLEYLALKCCIGNSLDLSKLPEALEDKATFGYWSEWPDYACNKGKPPVPLSPEGVEKYCQFERRFARVARGKNHFTPEEGSSSEEDVSEDLFEDVISEDDSTPENSGDDEGSLDINKSLSESEEDSSEDNGDAKDASGYSLSPTAAP